MRKPDHIETISYGLRRAFNAWTGEALARDGAPPKAVSDLVWELLLVYAQSFPHIDEAKEDIQKGTYELAAMMLAQMRWERLTEIYRDALVGAMVSEAGECTCEECRALVTFSNLLSGAFSEAHADALRRTIRQDRAERLSDELKLAKRIQSHLLPKSIPKIPGFDFAGRIAPAAEVGGDYWSVKHYPDDGIVTMKLADVSGHGIAAATLVAAVKFISGGYYRGSESAAEVIRQTNRVLTKETPYDVIVTMVYGWLRPSERKLTIVNAGHEPAFICRRDSCIDILPTGPILGVTETAAYEEKTFALRAGDVVFFGSDGITEAGVGERFGLGRLKELVVGHRDLSADDLADKVIETVMGYADRPHDDISLLVVKVTRRAGVSG